MREKTQSEDAVLKKNDKDLKSHETYLPGSPLKRGLSFAGDNIAEEMLVEWLELGELEPQSQTLPAAVLRRV